MLLFFYWCSEENKLFQGSIFFQKKNTLKKWNTSMVHTNHFIHGQCTGMNVIKGACHIFMGHGDVTSGCSVFASWDFLAGGWTYNV